MYIIIYITLHKKGNCYWSHASGKMLYAQELSPLLTHWTHYLVSKPYNNKPQGGGASLMQLMSHIQSVIFLILTINCKC